MQSDQLLQSQYNPERNVSQPKSAPDSIQKRYSGDLARLSPISTIPIHARLRSSSARLAATAQIGCNH